MKIIFIPVIQSFIARSILGTDAFGNIRHDPNLRFVIFAPHYKVDFYKEKFNQPNIIIEGIEPSKFDRSANSIFQELAILMLPTYFVRYRMKERNLGIIRYVVGMAINYVLAPWRIFHQLFRFLDRTFTSTDKYDSFFEKYRPDLVFSPDIFNQDDAVLLMAARKHGTKTLGMVRSWDCTTNKNLVRSIPSKIIVNNELIKEELVRLHDVEDQTVVPVGFPQFDHFINPKLSSREEFFKEIGVDPGRRLILIAPGGKALTDTDWEFCDMLKRGMDDGRLPDDVHVLIRNHPQSSTDLSKFQNNGRFIVDNPGQIVGGHRRAAEMLEADILHAANSLAYCELLISLNTSLGLEILNFDKPHIMLGFDGYEKKPFEKSVRRYHREDNMKNFIESGAVCLAHNPEELVEFTRAYLKDPSLDVDGRERARKEILYRTDGRAGERVAEAILDSLT